MYQAKIAPIEYTICDVYYELQRRIDRQHNTNYMKQMVYDIVGTVGDNGNFNNTFAHCGYTIMSCLGKICLIGECCSKRHKESPLLRKKGLHEWGTSAVKDREYRMSLMIEGFITTMVIR